MSSVFSNEDLDYLLHHPEVLAAQEKLALKGRVYFTIPLTDRIRVTLQERLGLDLSHVSSIPMRWIKGDTVPHIDCGTKSFEHTYLVYLHDNPGEMIIGDQSYPITANTAYRFHEGTRHYTQNTGVVPRLLVGPMNEYAEPVGATIFYYRIYADAYAQAGNPFAYQGITWILNDTVNMEGTIEPYTTWRIATIAGYSDPIPTGVYPNGFDLATLGLTGYTIYVYPTIPCFLEGSALLCLVNGVPTYQPIEMLTQGSIVKTSLNGYKRVEFIGKRTIHNPGNKERIQNRLYR